MLHDVKVGEARWRKAGTGKAVLVIRNASRFICDKLGFVTWRRRWDHEDFKKCPGSRGLVFAAKMATEIYAVLRASVP